MKMFGQRLPLWITIVPLLAGLLAYALWWKGKLDLYRAETRPWLGAGALYGGFPYRLQADAGPVTRTLAGADTRLTLSAARVTVDRQPWQASLSVIGFAGPKLDAAAPGLGGARAGILAARGRASIDTAFGRIVRLSSEFTDAIVTLGILPMQVTVGQFEVHMRETPVAPILLPTGPKMPAQAEVVVRGETVRLGGGDALALEARLAVTSSSPLRSARGWAAGAGTVELQRLTLGDAHGIVVDANATIVPGPDRGLRVTGTLTTVCPSSVLAAMAGKEALREFRARVPLHIAFGGPIGAVVPMTNLAALGRFGVRAQEAPCPVLRLAVPHP
jgi:hypothetical protein